MDLEILKIASNTKNHKTIKNFTHFCKNKNRICGDVMEISLVVKNNKITDFGYQCKSCIYCQASVSLLSQNVINSNLKEVFDLLEQSEFFFEKKENETLKKWKSLGKIINEKNIARKDCLLLPFTTLSKALKNE